MGGDYVPNRGDIVLLESDPPGGGGDAECWAALVVSPKIYNQKVGLALFCPVTSQIKGYPFEVILPGNFEANAAILSDQVSSLDWRTRKAKRVARAPNDVIDEVMSKVVTLIESDS